MLFSMVQFSSIFERYATCVVLSLKMSLLLSKVFYSPKCQRDIYFGHRYLVFNMAGGACILVFLDSTFRSRDSFDIYLKSNQERCMLTLKWRVRVSEGKERAD